MQSELFKKVPFNKVRKNDLIFMIEDQIVHLVIKKTRKLVKMEQLSNKKITWATRLRFEQRGYFYLEK